MALLPRSFGLSDVGRVRKKNEDSYLIDDVLGLYIVADGMGGHAGGEVASAEAIDQIFSMIRKGLPQVAAFQRSPDDNNRGAVRRIVEAAIQAATYMVFGIAEQDPSRKGMGTTISCMMFTGPHAIVGQVGDSRVYLVRQDVPVQITEDHTLVNMQLKAGAITAEQARTVPYQNLITRAVGVKDYVEVDVFDMECAPGDRFVLCSDGVHGYLKDEVELGRLAGRGTREDAARALVSFALQKGGRDNATALVVDIQADREASFDIDVG
ncbi:MAG: serine/threonine-protein phosphatase [Deltaproteobacteria bacterium]|nr:serine/threonine-protein phosphatase [Deltaproteobacteria bacterium]